MPTRFRVPAAAGATGDRPSLKAVAAAAGVSVATASLALRNSSRCAVTTRALVAKAAERLGYVPDPQLARLMSYLQRPQARKEGATIAYITAFPERDDWRGLHTWQKYYTGAERRAAELGYRLEEFWLREPGMSDQRLSTILQTRGINGLIIAPLPAGVNRLNLDWSRFAAVALGFSLQEPQLHRVAHDHFHSMVLVMERIRQLGFKRVALVMSKGHDQRVAGQWSAAFLGERYGRGATGGVIFDGPDEPDRLATWFRRIRPEVIVSDMLKVAWHLERAGLTVPADYAFVHLNLPFEGRELAGMDQHSERVGEAAVKQLVAALLQNETGVPHLPDTTLVRGEWVEGLSLADRTAPHKTPVAITPLWNLARHRLWARGGDNTRPVAAAGRSPGAPLRAARSAAG